MFIHNLLFMIKNLLLFSLVLGLHFAALAQKPLWKELKNTTSFSEVDVAPRAHTPKNFLLFETSFTQLSKELYSAPEETTLQDVQQAHVVSLPTAEGKIAHFWVFQSATMEPELAARYPEIRSFKAVQIDQPSYVVHLSISPEFGMHLVGTLSDGATYYIDTYTKDRNTYILYQRNALTSNTSFTCLTPSKDTSVVENQPVTSALADDGKYRTYRLAMACTTEYAAFHINAAGLNNGSLVQKKQAVLAAMNVTVTRMNAIFERDLATKFVLVNNNDQLVFVNQDNFSNDDVEALIDESQSVITSTIGSPNFDIGHTVSTGAGGLASLGGLCVSNEKALGVTGTSAPVGDAFDVDYVSHEIGHQMGANHTFNATTGFCGGYNRNQATAMEPGSGSTIMGYASLCGLNNVQMQSDPYFHWISLQEMSNKIQSSSCGTLQLANNPIPTIQVGASYTIPHSTPFALTATATDANNPTTLTYTWEQGDQNNSIQPPLATNGVGPLFRSLPPNASPTRYFPSYATVLEGTTASNGVVSTTWERLPSVARLMNFTATVRDNNALHGGQTKAAKTTVTTANAGPFVLTYPNNINNNTPVVWASGSQQTITWNVAGTQANGINTSEVKISYSIDNGTTFEPLVAATPNDGSEVITLPNFQETQTNVRIKIEAIGNIFYTVSKKITINGENASQNDFLFDQFTMYPNPTTEQLHISFVSDQDSELVFELYDSKGARVYKETVKNTGSIRKTIAMSSFSAGIYILTITDGNHKMTKKIIKK